MSAPSPDQRTLVLLAGALLAIPARRLRALACGDDGALREWLANESATRLAEARRDARLALVRLHALGARLIALGDDEYPGGLLSLRDPPPFLIVRGGSLRASGPEGTAIVGTREPDAQAAAFATALAQRVAPPVVSGLARGIDFAAHTGALDAGLRTIAYVGYGLGADNPSELTALEERIVAAGGTVASERLPDLPAAAWALVKRDRLQAAHASAVVLIQSELGGGAMHTMRFARELERPRFARAPRVGARYAGNARAIADGATELPWEAEEAARLIASRAGLASHTGRKAAQ